MQVSTFRPEAYSRTGAIQPQALPIPEHIRTALLLMMHRTMGEPTQRRIEVIVPARPAFLTPAQQREVLALERQLRPELQRMYPAVRLGEPAGLSLATLNNNAVGNRHNDGRTIRGVRVVIALSGQGTVVFRPNGTSVQTPMGVPTFLRGSDDHAAGAGPRNTMVIDY